MIVVVGSISRVRDGTAVRLWRQYGRSSLDARAAHANLQGATLLGDCHDPLHKVDCRIRHRRHARPCHRLLGVDPSGGLGRRRLGRGFHHHWGPGLGVGIALGALGAAGAYAYGGGCYVTREAVRDVYGNFLYSRPVRVCD
jgi:hypothetical protein